jgi:hypothetical protein
VEAEIKMHSWIGYSLSKIDFANQKKENSDKGKEFLLMHRQIIMFKALLKGIHSSFKSEEVPLYVLLQV